MNVLVNKSRLLTNCWNNSLHSILENLALPVTVNNLYLPVLLSLILRQQQ